MFEVKIGSASEHLMLRPDESGPITQTVTAELSTDGLRAERTVVHHYSSGFDDLAQFFVQLSEDWRGWDGLRSWESLEGDLNIEARHEYRHVQLRVTLRSNGPGWGNDGWVATANLTIDPGEQLTQIAADLRELAEPFRGGWARDPGDSGSDAGA